MILIDTSVWSLALRRRVPDPTIATELARLIRAGSAALVGPVRQELLSGIRAAERFTAVRDRLRAFPDVPLDTADYEEAAACFSSCRARGVQGSNTDFLLCAVCRRREWPIFTTDHDFERYRPVLGLQLHRAGA